MAGLHRAAPPPFLSKTFEVRWKIGDGRGGVVERSRNSCVILKHDNFSSFFAGIYNHPPRKWFQGFRKVDTNKWDSPTRNSWQDRRDPTPNTQWCQGAGTLGLEKEVERLCRERSFLFLETVKLCQQQRSPGPSFSPWRRGCETTRGSSSRRWCSLAEPSTALVRGAAGRPGRKRRLPGFEERTAELELRRCSPHGQLGEDQETETPPCFSRPKLEEVNDGEWEEMLSDGAHGRTLPELLPLLPSTMTLSDQI
ncbi:unnamed protein product [Spirodela intermedia]|uniref:Uncharacterized protein n=1 Tax=Spirodela intermedia TaxID=51605 RepID=A0A7I8JQ23_SPIIN|nr:unnamed protein product [Spirodela intermedia]CAA6671663.1 unnamed protein product [Spirodela intermedia]